MSTDLKTQLAAYGRYHQDQQQSIDLGEITANDDAVRSLSPAQVVMSPPVGHRRGLWAAAAAVLIGVLIGGVAWLSQGSPDDEVIDQPIVTKPNVVTPDAWVLKDHSLPNETFPRGSALYAVVASDSLLVAVGTDSVICCASGVDGTPTSDGSAAVWTSVDAVNWVRVPHEESVLGGPGGQAMYRVVAGPDGFVAGGVDGEGFAVWASADGFAWSRVPQASIADYAIVGFTPEAHFSSEVFGVIPVRDGFLGVSDLGGGDNSLFPFRSELLRSDDGVDWEPIGAFPYPEITDLVAYGEMVVAVGIGGEGREFHAIARPILPAAEPERQPIAPPLSKTGLITPDRWTASVKVVDRTEDEIAQYVSEVTDLEGVLDIVQLPASWDAWNAVTGWFSICSPGDYSCGGGFVVLVEEESLADLLPSLEQGLFEAERDVILRQNP